MDGWNDWLRGESPVTVRVAGLLDAGGFTPGPLTCLVEPAADGPGVVVTVLDTDQTPTPIDASDHVLVPGLVNAHTHLDLTHIGPRPYDPADGFDSWLGMILRNRASEDRDIRDAVRLGLRRSIAGGVVAIGDIAGTWSTAPAHELAASPLAGVSYIEGFGLGDRQATAVDRTREAIAATPGRAAGPAAGDLGVRVGSSPHAPYTAGPAYIAGVAEAVGGRRAPVMVHVAESMAEREFVAAGTGPNRGLLERIGVWNETSLDGLGEGLTPVEHVVRALGANARGVAFAHVNDASDADIDRLREAGVGVAYCPRASAYFDHHADFGPHRYRDMIRVGVAVGLGTDSIVNCPPEQGDRLSTLDDARVLVRRDGLDPVIAIGLATVGGASVLGLDPDFFRFSGGHVLASVGLLRIDPDHPDPPAGAMALPDPPMLYARERLLEAIPA